MFIMVPPQCRKDSHWIDADMHAQVLAALKSSVRELNGDRSRPTSPVFRWWLWNLAHGCPIPRQVRRLCADLRRNAGPPGKGDLSVGLAKDPPITDPYAETARCIASTPIWIFHEAQIRWCQRNTPASTTTGGIKAYAEPDLVALAAGAETEPLVRFTKCKRTGFL